MYKRILFVLLVISLLAPPAALAAESGAASSGNTFQIGMHFGDLPFSGIAIKKRVSSGLMLEGMANLNEYVISASGRLLFDLGNRGHVFRYIGIGVGGGSATYITESMASVQGFIGIDYPINFFGLNQIFSFSTEIVMQATQVQVDGKPTIVPKTGLNWGWHYWF